MEIKTFLITVILFIIADTDGCGYMRVRWTPRRLEPSNDRDVVETEQGIAEIKQIGEIDQPIKMPSINEERIRELDKLFERINPTGEMSSINEERIRELDKLFERINPTGEMPGTDEVTKSEKLSNRLLEQIRLHAMIPGANEEKIRKLDECFEEFERQMEMQSKLSSEYSSEHEPAPSTSTETGESSSSPSPNTQQNDNLSQQNYSISDDEIKKLSESLFEMDKNNAYKYITVNLQNETKEHCTVDNAPLPLLDIKPEAYEIPTIKSLRALYENSEIDKNKTEELLNRYLETDVFKMTMKFLVEKNLISSNKYKFKNTLRRIWFSNQYLKFFEILMEYRNWIYFAKEEEQKNIDYRGYIKNIKLADKGEAINLCFNVRDIGLSVTILFGLSPELEMALYTACYYLRPRNNCTVSLGGKDINLFPHKIFYYTYDKRI